MKEDSTFLLSESTGWVVDWAHPAYEICTDNRRGGTYGKITYTVTKDPCHDWKGELGDGQWYKHTNEVTVLKHMSAGVTMVCLEVHYESYVNRHGRKRRTDVMPFRNGQNGYTNHFRQNIAFFMSGYGMTLSRCASICHTTPAIVKDVDKARLSSLAGDMRPRHYSSHLAVDEFLIEHGHRYCTIVIDADTGELLYLEKGKRKEQLMHFFRWVGDDFMSHVEAIAMDMNTNYSQAVKEGYPSISIVYDTFHIIKWYNDQVVDSLRRQEGKRLRKVADKLASEGRKDEATMVEEERKLLFGARFLLLANNRTLEAKDKLNRKLNVEAKESASRDGRNPDRVGHRRTDNADSKKMILASNEKLQNAVKAREELSDILSMSGSDLMRRRLEEWSKVYSDVGISQLTKFTKTILNRMEGIVSRSAFHISSGRIEGVNGFIKALRRSAFGYQDFDYFALLIWEQTHKDVLYGSPHGKGPRKAYSRKCPYNRKRLKQTVFILPADGCKEAM